jgi:ClpP class serine protease
MKSLILQKVFQKHIIMKTETLKLGLIDRLMRINEASTLQRMEMLITQAEMESRAEESLKAIDKGDVLSMHQFSTENKQWLKKKYTK